MIIADDSDLIHERLCDMISELPEIEIVGQARDGPTATQMIKDFKPDIVVLDIRMPRETGIDVLKKIRNDSVLPLIIIFTNYPYPQYRNKCAELGADYFFDKNSEFEKLNDTLKQLTHDYFTSSY